MRMLYYVLSYVTYARPSTSLLTLTSSWATLFQSGSGFEASTCGSVSVAFALPFLFHGIDRSSVRLWQWALEFYGLARCNLLDSILVQQGCSAFRSGSGRGRGGCWGSLAIYGLPIELPAKTYPISFLSHGGDRKYGNPLTSLRGVAWSPVSRTLVQSRAVAAPSA